MSPSLKIAIRYLFSVKGSTLLITLIAVFGVFLSVSAIILTLGVFTGFQDQLKDKLLSTSAHVIITNVGEEDLSRIQYKIAGIKEIRKTVPFTLYNAILSKGDNVQPVTVKAVNYNDKDFVDLIKPQLKKGKVRDLVIGKGISEILNVKPGESVVLVSPLGIRTPTGFIPKTKEMHVGGVFYTGSYDRDFVIVYMNKRDAERFFKRGMKFEGIEVFLKDPYSAQKVKAKIEEKLGKDLVIVRSWIDLNKPLFNALQLEKLALFLILLLMVVVASFNITSLLFVKSREKLRDIAILKTFGMKTQEIQRIFVSVGLTIGVVGSTAGIIFSHIMAYLINEYKLIRVPEEVYMMTYIPVHIELPDLLATFLGTLILSFASSLIPSRKASKENVVRILRNE